MLRYVLSFPAEIHREALEQISEMLKEAANDQQFRDIVISHGGTITDMRRRATPYRRRPEPRIIRPRRSTR